MNTYAELISQRERIRQIVAAHHGANPRVFGSIAKNMQGPTSDVDLLIDTTPETSMLDLVRMQDELTRCFGIQFDVNTLRGLPRRWRDQVAQEAVAL